jgi:hypothetical protein
MLTANSSYYDNNHVCEELCQDSVKIFHFKGGETTYEEIRITRNELVHIQTEHLGWCSAFFPAYNPAGELIFSVFAALAQFERGLIRERTQAGLAAAREKGRIGGRPSLSKSDQKVQLAQEMTEKGMKTKDVCLALGISRSTYYRYLKLNDKI